MIEANAAAFSRNTEMKDFRENHPLVRRSNAAKTLLISTIFYSYGLTLAVCRKLIRYCSLCALNDRDRGKKTQADQHAIIILQDKFNCSGENHLSSLYHLASRFVSRIEV